MPELREREREREREQNICQTRALNCGASGYAAGIFAGIFG
jgi:hypothetical protein